MKTSLVTAPVKSAVDILNLRDHIRLDYDFGDDDSTIERLSASAVARIENLTGRKLITQTWKVFFDDWPEDPSDRFEIPFGQLQSVTHLKYTDNEDNTSTWAATNYKVDTYGDPGHLILGYNKSWPTDTLAVTNAIEIQFVCGYGTDETDIPEDLRLAVRMLVSHWYEHREGFAIQVGLTQPVEIPEGVYDLIEEYRIRGFHRC